MSKPVLDYYVESRDHEVVTAFQTNSTDAAWEQFIACVRAQPGQSLVMRGPGWCTCPPSTVDPLIIGAEAVRAVLTEQEYQAIVLGEMAKAVLGS